MFFPERPADVMAERRPPMPQPQPNLGAHWSEEDERRLTEAVRRLEPCPSLSSLVRRLVPSFSGRSEKGMYRHLTARLERDADFAALVRSRLPGREEPSAGPGALELIGQLCEEHMGAMNRADAERLAGLGRRFGSSALLAAVASAVVARMSIALDEVERRCSRGAAAR